MQKYNIAYIPKHPELFIPYARELSQTISSDKYLLCIGSIPHVSLCHFARQSNEIDSIWKRVVDFELPSMHLTFKEKRSKFYPSHPKGDNICWVSLIPNHCEKLSKFHWLIADLIKTPLNRAFSEYDPHLTLFNSYDQESCALLNQTPEVNPPLEDDFSIALGLMDELGQITEILFL